MNFTPVKTPSLLRRAFPRMIWHLPSEEQTLYLTFDDGPTPEITDWVLDTLNQFNATATFFCIGKNVEDHPELYYRIIKEGHAIGNHTHNHVKGWKSTKEQYLDNIEKASKVIDSKLFRPPYGQITPIQSKLVSKNGYHVIMWTILSVDWNVSTTQQKCADNVINNSNSGDIIVFHDSLKAATNLKYALPKVLEHFNKKGFQFKRIPESIQ